MLEINKLILSFVGFTILMASMFSNENIFSNNTGKASSNWTAENIFPATILNDTLKKDTLRGDTTKSDTLKKDAQNQPYKKSKKSTYEPKDRFGDPISEKPSPSPLLLSDPSKLEFEIDTAMDYTIYEKIGDTQYRPATTMSFEEYSKLQEKTMLKNYWQNRAAGLDGESAVSGRSLIPPIHISPVFDRIFGGSLVDIRPSGFATLDFGGRFQRTDNPATPVRQQRNGSFEFEQQISMNVIGKIGDKMAIIANFDNNNSFDFENDLRLEYTGYEEDIIKKIEIGNVSMPINNSLMSGGQNLFGIKTQLQFGRLFVTGIASTQRGRSDAIELEGGVQGREFAIRGSDYDDNRHFFLGHFFRDNYGVDNREWLNKMPQITSGINITRMEVYVMNRNNNTETLRNVVAFTDLGEGKRIHRRDHPLVGSGVAPVISPPTANDANMLYKNLTSDPEFRNSDDVDNLLQNDVNKFSKSTDYDKINQARKLNMTEYEFHAELGYISLNKKLSNDEILAVSYEYTYNGKRYKVGELSEDYQNRPENEVIFLKLLRPAKVNLRVPTWDLMMKNIYSLNSSQINPEGFQLRVIYRDDNTGIDNPSLHEGTKTKDIPLVQLLGLDRLNQMNDPQPDGNFDFVPGVTINPERGYIIFPVLEPFGAQLKQHFAPEERNLINKYVYDTLYSTTKADAELVAVKNKFFINGKYQASSSSEIALTGINIAEGSVQVYAGNTPLVENVDYTVDYMLGRVSILNQGVMSSGKKIRITYEKADLFNFQTRSLMGTRMDYVVSEDFNVGATLLYVNERPLISRVNIGDEPLRNMQYGFDFNYKKDSRFLTKMVDAIPFISTKELSSINLSAEFAQLVPGTSNKVDGEGASYIDDFESSAIATNLGSNSSLNWKLAATPETNDGRYGDKNSKEFTYNRAKIAWYSIDNVFHRRGASDKPANIPTTVTNHYERQVTPQEVFPQRQREALNFISTFDLAYFPAERGQYNFYSGIVGSSPEGLLPNPARNYGGISRAFSTEVDFDKINAEYIEFWMMDPFINHTNNSQGNKDGMINDGKNLIDTYNHKGGELFFNLGNISEDIMRNGRHDFENGLPADYDPNKTVPTEYGRSPKQQYLPSGFETSTAARANQDIGLDGLKNQDELSLFDNPDALPEVIRQDPSQDDFRHYLDPIYDQRDAHIVARYKNFNGMEGNSPAGNLNRGGSTLPDNEDLNGDNTINDLEEYYEYKINLKPQHMVVGKNFIVDEIVDNSNEAKQPVKWYLFRVPIRQPTGSYGQIEGFKSIRFMRTYLTGFEQPVVLRLLKFQLVGSQWRQFQDKLDDAGFDEAREKYDPKFTVSVVNIEENSTGGGEKPPYVLPPGINRDRDNTSAVERQVNEQSLQICVDDLKEKDARAVFKNVNMDFINYGRLKMFLHANGDGTEDGEVTGFIRIGTDFTENYYEVEVPLKIWKNNQGSSPEVIWPKANEIDIAFNDLYALKAARDRLGHNMNLPYKNNIPRPDGYTLTVRGRPDLSTVQTIMIGVKNPNTLTPRSVCVWANELRVVDFDRAAGWAANARLNAKLADFINLTASTRYSTYGFGGIQQRISERAREEITQYDIAANITLDKLLPERAGIKIPMYVGYERSRIVPRFDPLDPDIPLEASVLSIQDPEQRENYQRMAEDRSTRRSLNFTNVRKVKTGENPVSRIFDIENLAFSYSYNDVHRTNITTAAYDLKSHRGGVAYNFSPKEWSIEPFQNKEKLNSPHFQALKDFNFSLVPENISFRGDLDRRFVRTQLRDRNLQTDPNLLAFEKFFTFNRIYNMRWNLTRGLNLDYSANVNAIIDEPMGEVNAEARRVMWNNVKALGRMRNFDQRINANYRLPLDKIPYTDWINADARYEVSYSWLSGSFDPRPEFDQRREYGNTIQNNREKGINTKFDLVKLYNKVRFLKDINTPAPVKRPGTAPLKTDTAEVKKPDLKFAKGIARTLMSVKSINVNYSEREGTLLPGFLPQPFLLGMDSGFNAPGLPFILGSQNTNIKEKSVQNNWLAPSLEQTMPFRQSRIVDLNLRAMVEPFTDLKIQVDARKMKQGNYQEIYRYDSLFAPGGTFIGISPQSLTPSRAGSYSITFLAIKTAFVKDGEDNSSPLFTNFEDYRAIFKDRLDNQLASQTTEELRYSLNHQDVLVPAFIAAYSGRDPNKTSTSNFPAIPLPNWNINYAGLSKVAFLSQYFASINLTHAYSSTFDINNYTSSLLYDDNLTLNHQVERTPPASIRDEDGVKVLAPRFVLGQVIISERFAPLIGINFRTKSKINGRVEYKTERNMALQIMSSQITELNSNDILLDFGYTKAGMKLPFKIQGETLTLDNDITFRMGLTIRDTKSIQRKIDEINTITNGNINFQLRPTVNYVVNQKLSVLMYFERTINEPRITNSFRRTTSSFGAQVRFSLAQ